MKNTKLLTFISATAAVASALPVASLASCSSENEQEDLTITCDSAHEEEYRVTKPVRCIRDRILTFDLEPKHGSLVVIAAVKKIIAKNPRDGKTRELLNFRDFIAIPRREDSESRDTRPVIRVIFNLSIVATILKEKLTELEVSMETSNDPIYEVVAGDDDVDTSDVSIANGGWTDGKLTINGIKLKATASTKKSIRVAANWEGEDKTFGNVPEISLVFVSDKTWNVTIDVTKCRKPRLASLLILINSSIAEDPAQTTPPESFEMEMDEDSDYKEMINLELIEGSYTNGYEGEIGVKGQNFIENNVFDFEVTEKVNDEDSRKLIKGVDYDYGEPNERGIIPFVIFKKVVNSDKLSIKSIVTNKVKCKLLKVALSNNDGSLASNPHKLLFASYGIKRIRSGETFERNFHLTNYAKWLGLKIAADGEQNGLLKARLLLNGKELSSGIEITHDSKIIKIKVLESLAEKITPDDELEVEIYAEDKTKTVGFHNLQHIDGVKFDLISHIKNPILGGWELESRGKRLDRGQGITFYDENGKDIWGELYDTNKIKVELKVQSKYLNVISDNYASVEETDSTRLFILHDGAISGLYKPGESDPIPYTPTWGGWDTIDWGYSILSVSTIYNNEKYIARVLLPNSVRA